MRITKMFGKTLREVPADADTVSHQLLLKSGMINQLTTGVYSYMPLAWRVIRKIEDIIRDEMNAAGGQELAMHDPRNDPGYALHAAVEPMPGRHTRPRFSSPVQPYLRGLHRKFGTKHAPRITGRGEPGAGRVMDR